MKRSTLLIGLATILMPGAALAAEGDAPQPPAPIAAPVLAEAAASAENAQNETTAPIADTELAGERGGHALAIGNQTLTAINTGSVISGNYNAGGVSISDNALSNFNGIGNVVINTGAQNNLQSGMNLVINIVN